MEKMNDLRDLLKHEVQDLLSAEQQIIDALPKMIEKASNPSLKKSLQEHLQVTQNQKKRCEQVLELMKVNNQEQSSFLSGLFGGGDKVCKGMQGLIKEGEKILEANIDPKVMDAAIIASAQKIEHYEICGYGTVRAYARELNLSEVANLLEQTLNEEYDADDLLTSLAYGGLNQKAEGRSSRQEKDTARAGSSRTSHTNKKASKASKTSSSNKKSNGATRRKSSSRKAAKSR